MKSILNKIGTGIFIVFILFFGLKGCVHTVYSKKNIEIYEQVNENGESNKIYIVPSNHIVLKKQFEDQFEYAVFHVRGSDATHYFGSLYNSGESLLGLRIYNNAIDVWKTEMELVDKKGNLTESTFQEIGETYQSTLIIRENSIEFGDYEYKKLEPTQTDIEFVNQIKANLK